MKVNLPDRGWREVKESTQTTGNYLWQAHSEGTWFVCTPTQNAVIKDAISKGETQHGNENIMTRFSKKVSDKNAHANTYSKETPTIKDMPAVKLPLGELPPKPEGKEYGFVKGVTIGELIKEKLKERERATNVARTVPINGPPVVVAKVALKKGEDPKRIKVRAWMRLRARCYDTSTQAAEACADELNLYENTRDYKIPEYVFEIAGSHLPTT